MAKNLIIVESPGKIKTLSKFLGSNFIVEASKGHVIDLPPSRFGVSPENGFVPFFRVVKDRQDVIVRLQKIAKTADKIYLAPDPDREGEAISWHLANVLGIDPLSTCRVTFNSITKNDVLKSLDNPRSINFNLVNAQQSRRILDRLVGYRLSPLLWNKICLGLSAGRVQSVAILFICDREQEILAFEPEEYWTISADIQTEGKDKFQIKLTKTNGKKSVISNEEAATKVVEAIKAANLKIDKVSSRDRKQSPPPPFITSTLQAEAAQKFSFTPRRTMSIAQKLYEGIELGKEGHTGLITYMRTDSTRVAPEGLAELDAFLLKTFESNYRLEKRRIFKAKKGAQDAHEAIRPTSVWRTPELMAGYLKPEQLKLYTLIWRRYVSSQMADAKFKVVTADIDVEEHTFQASGTTLTFDGYTSLYTSNRPDSMLKDSDKQKLPVLSEGEALKLVEVDPKQNFTNPPPRYNESSLIKTLEKEGIGRPSTYATIVETIQQRKYVRKIEGKFHPADAAFVVTGILKQCFADIINPGFTAGMESDLDHVEEGRKDWVGLLSEFYEPFMEDLKKAEEQVKKVHIQTDYNCEKCGKNMVVRLARTGKFLACTGYPECKNTINIPDDLLMFTKGRPEEPMLIKDLVEKLKSEAPPDMEPIDEKCEKCGAQMVIRNGRYGRFIACSKYPECKNTRQIVKEIGVDCPNKGCDGKILEKKSKRGRLFYGCSKYPECEFTTWAEPTGELCPDCSAPLVKHSTKKLGAHVKCSAKGCKYKKFPEGEGNDEKK